MERDPLVSLDQAPFVTLSADQLSAVIARHSLDVALDDVQQLASTGIVHTIYALGTDLVLRVPKEHPEAIADACTGMVATPAATAAGVSTPALITFDESLDILSVPFSIFERASGEPLFVRLGAHPQELASVWRDLGRDLATLHANVTECPDPNGYLDPHDRPRDHEALVASLEAGGYLGRDAAVWIDSVLRRLHPTVASPSPHRRFIHGDVSVSNVLVEGDRYGSLIDWDDAGWGDPAMEFVSLPLRAVDATLVGYRSLMPVDDDDTAEQRILWDKLLGALWRLRSSPEPPRTMSSPTPSGRLFDLFAAAADGDTPITRHLRR